VATASDNNEGEKLKDGEKITETANITYSIYPIFNTNKIRVVYQKNGNMFVSVKIYDEKMNLLYNDTQRKNGYLKRNYNMDRIGSGEYIVKIEAGDYTTIQRVNVGEAQNQEFSAYLSPELNKNKLRVAYQHATNPVSMFIYDQEGALVFKKSLNEQNYSSLFDMGSLNKGTYTIVVKSGTSTTEKTYKL